MDQKQLDEFRNLLEKRLTEVKNTHDEHKESLPSMEDPSEVQSGDWSQRIEGDEVEEQVVLSSEHYMEKIRKALQRIESGSYGKCEWCNKEIPLERLRAKPSVTLCLPCQEEKDNA